MTFYELKTHKLIHNGQRPFRCNECPKTYIKSINLRDHIDRVHKGIKKYFCDVCKTTVVSKDHFIIHTDLKPYSCSECKTSFNSLSNMKRHTIKHNDKRLKPFHCSKCFIVNSLVKMAYYLSLRLYQ